MAKKKIRGNRTWTKRDYYNFAKNELDERMFELLMIKVLGSKALSLKDAKEFLRLYLKHLSREFQSYDYIKAKDIAMTAVITETYTRRKVG